MNIKTNFHSVRYLHLEGKGNMKVSNLKISWAFIVFIIIFHIQSHCFTVWNNGILHRTLFDKHNNLSEVAPVLRGRRNTYRPREIKMRMIRFGKRDDSKYLTSLTNNDSTSLNPSKRDFWLPSGFWWPKDSSHQKFVKFLYLFKNTRPEEMVKKKKVKSLVKKNSLSMFPMPRTW